MKKITIKIRDLEDLNFNIKIEVKGFKKTKLPQYVGTKDEYDMILYEGRVYVVDHKGRERFIRNLKIATGTSINNVEDLKKFIRRQFVRALLKNKTDVFIGN